MKNPQLPGLVCGRDHIGTEEEAVGKTVEKRRGSFSVSGVAITYFATSSHEMSKYKFLRAGSSSRSATTCRWFLSRVGVEVAWKLPAGRHGQVRYAPR